MNVTTHSITPTSGRYVKLTSVYAEQLADVSLRVYDFEVYGS